MEWKLRFVNGLDMERILQTDIKKDMKIQKNEQLYSFKIKFKYMKKNSRNGLNNVFIQV